MPGTPRTLIVMPAFNESGSVAQVIAEVRRELPGMTCLVVDDGSGDDTAEVARRAGAIVARLPYNLGVGGAMRLGFRYALAHGFDNVVQIDSDGQHDPAAVPSLLAGLSTADIVIGARFAGQGTYRVRGPRRWAMSLLSGTLSRAAKVRLTDTTSGFKACGPRAVRLFADMQHLRDPNGGYWTGYVYPDQVNWPAEHTTYTAAAVLLAVDALTHTTTGSDIMRGSTLPSFAEIGLDCGCRDSAHDVARVS